MHIGVLMLCKKFELTLTRNFQVMAILKNELISEKYPVLKPMLLSENCLQSHPQFPYAM